MSAMVTCMEISNHTRQTCAVDQYFPTCFGQLFAQLSRHLSVYLAMPFPSHSVHIFQFLASTIAVIWLRLLLDFVCQVHQLNSCKVDVEDFPVFFWPLPALSIVLAHSFLSMPVRLLYLAVLACIFCLPLRILRIDMRDCILI